MINLAKEFKSKWSFDDIGFQKELQNSQKRRFLGRQEYAIFKELRMIKRKND